MENIYKEHLLKRKFELKEKIGSGLSGKTMKGIQTSLQRPVAIKFFDNQFNKKNIELKKRFLREAKILAELEHPSIPYVITNGTIPITGEEVPYIIMQYISGETLDEYIAKYSPITLDDALHISTQILDALHFSHERSIIHRDIKPSNIMILPSGHCYLIDFSIGFKENPSAGMTRVTKTGHHLGSPLYMSPEQKKDMKNVDKRSDIYSFAIVLCELLSKKPELEGLDAVDNAYPKALKKVIQKAMSFEVKDRYINASDFLRELKQVSPKAFPLIDTPSKAVCNNTLCPSANWSPNGYYKSAHFIEKCTDAFCTSCGNTLIYQCATCGSNIDDKQFCGGCGTQQFSVPECKQCGSYLTKVDINADTSIDGCKKCRKTKQQQVYQQQSYTVNSEEVPF